jgi:hypothetical protein
MDTKYTDVWVTAVRADYRHRKIVITLEVALTTANAAIIGSVAQAAQVERPMTVTFEEQQEMLPGMTIEIKSLS